MFELSFRAMGCQIKAFLDSEAEVAREELEMVPIWFENWEQILSRFREDSELSRVNRSDGSWIGVSGTFWNVLEAARINHFQSGGLVSPLLLQELEAIGYTDSFEELANYGTQERFCQPVHNRGNLNWEVGMEVDGQLVSLLGESRLDFGGVAKGWAAQECMSRLKKFGPVLVNAGGDIAISQAPRDEAGWRIGVENPFDKEDEILSLSLREGGLASSGTDRRHWQQNGQLQHHIIDPRSGKAVESDVLSCSLIAPNLLQAEMAAKMVLVMGSDAGLKWLDEQALMSGVVILQDASLRYAKGFDLFRVSDEVMA